MGWCGFYCVVLVFLFLWWTWKWSFLSLFFSVHFCLGIWSLCDTEFHHSLRWCKRYIKIQNWKSKSLNFHRINKKWNEKKRKTKKKLKSNKICWLFLECRAEETINRSDLNWKQGKRWRGVHLYVMFRCSWICVYTILSFHLTWLLNDTLIVNWPILKSIFQLSAHFHISPKN